MNKDNANETLKNMDKEIESMLQSILIDKDEEENLNQITSINCLENKKNDKINFEKFKNNKDLFNFSNDNNINVNKQNFNININNCKKDIISKSIINNKNNFKSNSEKIYYNNLDKNNLNQDIVNKTISFPIYYNNRNIYLNDNNINNNFNIIYNRDKQNKEISPNDLDNYLKEFKYLLQKQNNIDINIFNQIKNYIILLIKSQNGNKILQNSLFSTSNQIIHLIFNELSNNLILLLQDKITNTFCVKLYQYLNMNDKYKYLTIISNNIIKLCTNKISTYSIQNIIENLHSRNEKLILLNSIKLNLLKLSLDIYATHVIEKILITFEFEYLIEIYNFIMENIIFLSNHVNGLCIVKQTLFLQNKKEYYYIIKQKLKERSFELIENPYGNYALQIVIENWEENDLIDIFKQFIGHFTELSMMKYSSNVIEKILIKSEIFVNYFIQETCIEKKSIGFLIKNAYGNYVIQTCLKSSKGNGKLILMNSIQKNLGILGEKKLIIKWKNILSLNNQNINNINDNNKML